MLSSSKGMRVRVRSRLALLPVPFPCGLFLRFFLLFCQKILEQFPNNFHHVRIVLDTIEFQLLVKVFCEVDSESFHINVSILIY